MTVNGHSWKVVFGSVGPGILWEDGVLPINEGFLLLFLVIFAQCVSKLCESINV